MVSIRNPSIDSCKKLFLELGNMICYAIGCVFTMFLEGYYFWKVVARVVQGPA